MDVPPPIPPRPPGYEVGGGGPPPLPARNNSPTRQAVPSPASPQQQQPSFQAPPPQAQSQQWQQAQWDQWQEFLKFQQQQQQQQQQQSQQHYSAPRSQSQHGGNSNAPPGFGPPPTQPPPPPSQWKDHFFYSNGNPTPPFDNLMSIFFSKLDTQRSGYITPEVWSSWLDAIGFPTDENLWKKSLKGNWMFSAQDTADAELKWFLEAFYIDHKSVIRNPNAAHQLPWGGMPLLSLAGFTHFMAMEVAYEPDTLLRGLNNALRYYGVEVGKGPIPRHVLPERCPPEVKRRFDEGSARLRGSSQEKLDAQIAKSRIEAKGRQAALDLLDDRRYVYRYSDLI
ncbi:hypothetical protein CDEST_15272 [Colletotrichum destructivum]|uniref:DUF7514 domain-containing protein n=1 Tax=Colletotrichum destructivum TaxID=34406 RepID=A0AAX4J4G1_9PEZI|nr:hypothetical protein CDEST_15272 [Colletotrichum destructivum]